jgi:cell division protein FtsQ
LSDKLSAKLPVFTGFPSERTQFSKADKELLNQVKAISQYVAASEFWMAQVAQIDITQARTFEIVPTVGNHIIEFGDATNCDKKFRKLLLFYQQVISQSGFDLYERIKVQYAGQVVGVRHANAISKYDSIQAIKNVQRLIALAQTEQERWIRMDSIEMVNMRHRTDTAEAPAKLAMPDSSTEKPSITTPQNPKPVKRTGDDSRQ